MGNVTGRRKIRVPADHPARKAQAQSAGQATPSTPRNEESTVKVLATEPQASAEASPTDITWQSGTDGVEKMEQKLDTSHHVPTLGAKLADSTKETPEDVSRKTRAISTKKRRISLRDTVQQTGPAAGMIVPRRPPPLSERSVRFTTYLDKDLQGHVDRLHKNGTIASKRALVNAAIRAYLSAVYGIR